MVDKHNMSAVIAVAETRNHCNSCNSNSTSISMLESSVSNKALSLPPPPPSPPSRYESQKRRDWNTFGQYLKNHRPPLALSRCSGAHVLEFLRYLDQFGKTKVHTTTCPFFGLPHPPAPCLCPLRQAWGSLDALVGRLRAAFEENGGHPETNPFGARAVRLFLREVRDGQAKARGIAYEKKKKRKKEQQNGFSSRVMMGQLQSSSSTYDAAGFLISSSNNVQRGILSRTSEHDDEALAMGSTEARKSMIPLSVPGF
ncbi:hypothetical protein U1Q18_044120 [Sarracenia purpurea var. burkii]